MIQLEHRVNALVKAGQKFSDNKDLRVQSAKRKAEYENPWFTQENIERAISGVTDKFTNKEQLDSWLVKYSFPETSKPKILGLVLAGNIPMVGIHDIICGFLAGHNMHLKYSDKDKILIPLFIEFLIEAEAECAGQFEERERLNEADLVIATGSDNSSRYFDYYFGKIPNIIRKNRTSIAVLKEGTSREELTELGKDIFYYFGMGCRNVSKLYLPKGYPIELILEVYEEWKALALHNKYKNNFDYNYAIFLLNQTKFFANDCLIALEEPSIYSRISCIHFSYYDNLAEVQKELLGLSEKIQCIVSNCNFKDISVLPFGKSQSPELEDYADGVDTMKFLLEHHV